MVLLVGICALRTEVAMAADWDGPFDPWLFLCLASKPPVTPDRLWTSWSFAPEVVLVLGATLAVYAWRAVDRHGPLALGRVAAFLAGWLLLAVALVSPLCR